MLIGELFVMRVIGYGVLRIDEFLVSGWEVWKVGDKRGVVMIGYCGLQA